MNRGDKGENIFLNDGFKQKFIQYLITCKSKYLMQIAGFCIMDNHFHLIIKDEHGFISEFMHDLLTLYAIAYRKGKGGYGYVFQNRFKSQIIHYEKYMSNVIIYVMNNPCRKQIVTTPFAYKWSSVSLYFNSTQSFVDTEIVVQIFGTKKNFHSVFDNHKLDEIPIIETSVGQVIGEQWYASSIAGKFDRRVKISVANKKRKNDFVKINLQSAILMFELKIKKSIKDIDFNSKSGKIIRNQLLVFLKENCQMSYTEIKNAYPFYNIKYNALAKTYSRCKLL